GPGGGVANAFVAVDAPALVELVPPAPVVARFEIEHCRIRPHVALGQYQSRVEFLNHDTNVYALAARGGERTIFTQTLPFGAVPIGKPLVAVGVLELRDTI